MAKRRIESGDMFNQLVGFITETLPDGKMVYPNSPDIFIMIAARGNDLIFTTTSNSQHRTLDVLKRAAKLHDEVNYNG